MSAGPEALAQLIGGWFLLSDREPAAARPGSPGAGSPAPLTTLSWPSYPSASSQPAPYPTVPSVQVRTEDEDAYPTTMRTGDGGRQLLIPVLDSDCSLEEVRLLSEHADRVEVEIRIVAKPAPPGVSVAPDGSYGCAGASFSFGSGPHAVIDLSAPLGKRPVVIHREPSF